MSILKSASRPSTSAAQPGTSSRRESSPTLADRALTGDAVEQEEDPHFSAGDQQAADHSQSGAKPQKPPRPPKAAQPEDKDGRELMALLNERMPHLRHAPSRLPGEQPALPEPPDQSTSQAQKPQKPQREHQPRHVPHQMQALQELPPPPPLSNAGTNISKTMAREFEKLGGNEVFTAAATKLSKHVVALRTAIKDLADPVEQSVLLVELEFHLSNLPLSLRETSQWDDAFSTLKRQLHPEIEAMMQLKNQTAKFLMTLGKYLDKKTAFHDADAFLKIAPKGLAVLAKNISAHKPETERYELLVHFSRALSELAQSDAANEHPDFKLWMSTFISKDLWPAAGSTSTERIQALRTEFEQRVPDDAAWVEAHTEKSIRRSIESTFNRTADRTPPKLAKTCIDIVTAIGRAPLNSASKKQLVGELTAELAPFAQAARGPTPNDDPVLKMLVQVWNAIASEMQNNRSWPDLTADHQLMVYLTHAQHWRDDRH